MIRIGRRDALIALSATLAQLPLEAHAQRAEKEPRARAARPKAQATRGAATGSLAIVGARLHRAGEAPLENSVVVVEGERIVHIEDAAGFALASGQKLLDGAGKVLTAGLVDPLTRVGVAEVELEEASRDDALLTKKPFRPAFAVADGYNPASTLIAIARREGLTSVGVTPTGGLVMGQSAWADLAGDSAAVALAEKSLALHVLFSDTALGDSGLNRASALYRLRELFDDARTYRANEAGFDRGATRELGVGKRDLAVVVRALEGKLATCVHVDRASDILNVLALGKEHGLKLVLASVAEGWKAKDAIKDAGVPCIVYPLDHGPRNFAALGAREDNAAMLHAAGITIALSTGESHNARKLRQVAGNAVRAGLPWPAALEAITDAPAKIFGLGERYGAPKVGRLANLALWSGDPLELSSRVDALLIRGRETSLRSRQTLLFERHK